MKWNVLGTSTFVIHFITVFMRHSFHKTKKRPFLAKPAKRGVPVMCGKGISYK